MAPEAYVCHRTARRLRIKVPSRKGEAAYFARLAERFAFCPQVERAEVNALTGSLLLLTPAAGEALEAVAEFAQTNGLFRLGAARPLLQRVAREVGELDRGLRRRTNQELGLAEAAFLVFLGLGLYQLAAGGLTAPPWHAALWYALGLVMYSLPRPA